MLVMPVESLVSQVQVLSLSCEKAERSVSRSGVDEN